VAKIWGDSDPCDFILDSGHKLWRVQVKSRRFVNRHYIVNCRGSNRRYAAGEIDFIAAYIVPKDLWYVVPSCEAELHAQIYFYPEGCHRRSIYEIYREAWCQMACPRDGADPTCIKVERRCEREAGIGNCAHRGR